MKLISIAICAFLLAGCAHRHEPEVSADEAAGKRERSPGQIIMAAFELIPGGGFFLLPVEYALTGTTGLTEFWAAACDTVDGELNPQTGDCAFSRKE